MKVDCSSVFTRSGEQVKVLRVELPDEEYLAVVSANIDAQRPDRSERHNLCWAAFRQHMLQSRFDDMSVSVYLGYIGHAHVCTIPFFEGGYAAVIEDVSVVGGWRNKGICSAVLDAAVLDFAGRGGEYASLAPAQGDVWAIRAYGNAGFLRGRLSGIQCSWMTRVLRRDFEEARFRPGQECHVRPYRTGDGPKIHALTWVLRQLACGPHEDLFYHVAQKREVEAHVLVGEEATVLGFSCPADFLRTTFVVHPEHADNMSLRRT